MAQAMDYVEYLSREIGARPAGTEEEEQAALYIADEFQKETGFPATIEEFTSSANLEGGRAILSMITIVASVLAMLFNILTGPMFILALIAAVIYVMESYGKPVFSNRLARVPSQNVVAKYQPAESPESAKRPSRKRKIVLVAHYDTGKVTPKIIERVESMGLPLPRVCLWGMVAAAFFLLLRIFLGGAGGVGLIFINIVTVIAIIIVALPIVKAVLYRTAAYNEGANNNATGVAALLEVAKRISSGSLSEADLLAEEAAIHSAQEAYAQGVVPEGAQVTYEVGASAGAAPDVDEFDEYSEEERLLAAKAAIAALTGSPIEQRVYGDVSTERPKRPIDVPDVIPQVEQAVAGEPEEAYGRAEVTAASFAAVAAAAEAEKEAARQAEQASTGFENAPDWFVAAQRNAKRSDAPAQVQRSRYTEAIQATERELAERDRAREEEERIQRDAATRAALAAMRAEEQTATEDDLAQQDEGFFSAEPVAEQQVFAIPEVADEAYAEPVAYAVNDEPAVAFGDEWEAVAAEPAYAPKAYDEPREVEVPQFQVDYESQVPVVEEIVAEAEPPAVLDEVFTADEEVVVESEVEIEQIDKFEETPIEAEEPGQFEDRVQSEVVDLGQTIAYTPQMIRDAIRAEMAEQEAQQATEGARTSLDRIADIDIPEAEEEAAAQIRAREQLSSLPSLDEPASKPAGVPKNDNPSRSGLFRMLRSDVPSLTGSITPVQPQKEAEKVLLESAELPKIMVGSDETTPIDYDMQVPISEKLEQAAVAESQDDAAGEPADPFATVALRQPIDEGYPVDEYGDDGEYPVDEYADDPQDAEFAAPREVAVPKSRAGGFFSRLRRKGKADLEDTPQEWLDVDEDFEAREVGRERGGWESFRNDDEGDGKRNWEGGAFSRLRLGHVDTRSGEDQTADEPEELAETIEDHQLSEEIEHIYHFRNPDYNTEVWFVAIGSDDEYHDGAKAFVAEHKAELRGAMVIELESLGVGELCVASEEGGFRKVQASSRIKRFMRGATEATGLVLGQVKTVTDSITTVMQNGGLQAMHIMGVEDGRPALKGSADDIVENVDEMLLNENIDYIAELLKQE